MMDMDSLTIVVENVKHVEKKQISLKLLDLVVGEVLLNTANVAVSWKGWG